MRLRMLAFHLLIPLGLFSALLLVGVSAGTALFIGAIVGCMSMSLMAVRGAPGKQDSDARSDTEVHRAE